MKITMDGNAAASYVSYAFSETAIIYPITPSSPMAETADEKAARGELNLFGCVPKIIQMQSESGVAGALHGALTCGALATTYTCSQGLLLMQPVMYKIAGELLPTVFHVSARALATHALSIFGDHQDVMACRQTGFAFLCSSSVQEVMDFAVISHIATLKTSVPFVHFFDGFRTSHETTTIEKIEYEQMKALLNEKDIEKFRSRALSPEHPIQRGTAQNPDTYFQNREAANSFYQATPLIVQEIMNKLAQITGRNYHLFDYFGASDAEHVAVIMGSGCSVMEETINKMIANGEKVGVIKVRLYRPFCQQAFIEAIPKTCTKIVVLDRTKEAGCLGEPLYLDVCAALQESNLKNIRVYGGRYGLGLKDFTPSMCYAVFKNLRQETPKNHFTIGINDDVTHLSLDFSKPYISTPNDVFACKFYGLGSDGTVGANKNSVKIIGNHTPLHVQGYFCYDSRKSGGATISHLRFGQKPILSSYLIDHAHFVACHNPSYIHRFDMLSSCANNGIFLLNCPCETAEDVENFLPSLVKKQIASKHLRFFIIDATKIANACGLQGRTGTIMQAAFFALCPHILPYNQAKTYLIEEIKKTFAKKSEEVVKQNIAAIESVENFLWEMQYPTTWQGASMEKKTNEPKSEYFENFMRPILSLEGDNLPVSAFQADGSVPTGTSKLEKHGTPFEMPKWISENCIQCNQCSFVCPHACIRPIIIKEGTPTPNSFKTIKAVGIERTLFRIQVSPHDCMGCGVCANVCPAKNKALVMQTSTTCMPQEGNNWEFSQNVEKVLAPFPKNSVKGSQFIPPLFEFSYACAGCGETAYIKLLTQLFGEKMIIANATGCSSIYGGSAPTCPYTVNADGQGPAWANSLFEDNAEFGLGMRLAYDIKKDEGKSVWIIGGDGWAYDIGFGGLDHVLSSNANVNILVLDSEVYSNTGGQLSKSTPIGAVARFARLGKQNKKKDLGLIAMTYQNAYVAQVSMGANKQQLINAFIEAEKFNGPSIIIAYTPCIAHGFNMQKSVDEEKLAVETGHWILYRYDPKAKNENKPAFLLDSKAPTKPLCDFYANENRFASLMRSHPQQAKELLQQAEKDIQQRYSFLQNLSSILNS